MLTTEEKKLKEAMKILLRNGRDGKMYNLAMERYNALVTPERIANLSHEIEGIDWTARYADDMLIIAKMSK